MQPLSFQPQVQCGCGVRQPGVRMTTQKKEHACLERGYAERLQSSSEVAVQLQQQFEQRHFLHCSSSRFDCARLCAREQLYTTSRHPTNFHMQEGSQARREP